MQRRKCLQGVQPCAHFQRSSCAVLARKRRRNVQSQHLHEKPSIQTTRKAQANRAHQLTSSGPVHDGAVPQSHRPASQRRPRRPQQKACKPWFAGFGRQDPRALAKVCSKSLMTPIHSMPCPLARAAPNTTASRPFTLTSKPLPRAKIV